MPDQPWQATIHGALRHPERPAVLVLIENGGNRLPFFKGEEVGTEAMDRITPTMSEIVGARVWGLRQLYAVADDSTHKMEAIIALELLEKDWIPKTGQAWVALDDLKEMNLAPEMIAALTDFLKEKTPHPLRPPWAIAGWIDEAHDWVRAEIARIGFEMTELLPVKQWGISCVMRVKTSGPDFYFKCTNRKMPLFVNESEVTAALARHFPEHINPPAARRVETDWMLLPSFKIPLYKETNHEALRPEMLRSFAQLQIAALPHREDLLRTGVFDRRLAVLHTQVDELLDDGDVLEKLDKTMLDDLPSIRPVFHKRLDQLAALGIPETLVHGDLHSGNSALMNGKFIYFDWTDACISHPFFDLFSLHWLDADKEETSLAAYLDPWKTIVSEEKLREAVPLARALLHLHHAVSYRHIVAYLEPLSKSELDFTHNILQDAIREVNALP